MSSSAGYYGTAKDEIRQAINIVDLVSSYLPLHRQGSGFVTRCPWHDDNKPSLQVNPARQIWKCWPCNKGGDIFSFVMEFQKVDFREALQILADKAGIELKQFAPAKPVAPGSPDDKNALLAAAAWAEQQFHEFLLRDPGAEVARQYLEERGITPASVEKFHIGFCPDNRTWLLDRARKTTHSAAILEAVSLASQSEYGARDFFRNRVMFSIRDPQKRPIAFGGRLLPGAPESAGGKYINSRDTKIFNKSEHLYALDIAQDRARKSGQLTVVEGYTDVILCHQYGVDDVVACLGVALGERHIPVLKRYAETITLLLDGDKAGQAAMDRILELFIPAGVDLRILTLPDELDPAEFMLERGAESFQQLLQTKAVDALEHKIRIETAGIDIARETHRANAALENILSTVSRGAASGGFDTNSLRTQQLLARLARQFLLDEVAVRRRFDELCRAARSPRFQAGPTKAATPTTEPTLQIKFRLSALSLDEIELLEILVAHHDLASTALSELGEFDLDADATKLIFRTYRHLEETGESLDFNRMLAEIEDPQLKSLLVQIVETADRKAAKATIDPATRLRQLLQKIHRGHEQRIIQQREQFILETDKENTKEAAEQVHNAFLENLQAKRRQQGIIAPTEG